jgi:hypothetical protein
LMIFLEAPQVRPRNAGVHHRQLRSRARKRNPMFASSVRKEIGTVPLGPLPGT